MTFSPFFRAPKKYEREIVFEQGFEPVTRAVLRSRAAFRSRGAEGRRPSTPTPAGSDGIFTENHNQIDLCLWYTNFSSTKTRLSFVHFWCDKEVCFS